MRCSHSQRMAWLAAIAICGCESDAPHGDRPWCQVRVIVRNGSDPLTQAEAVLVADEATGGVDAGGPLDARGAIEVPVMPGKYILVVRPLPSLQEEDERDAGKRSAASPISKRFQTAATSPYHVDVAKGTKPVLTFDLAAPRP